MRVPPLPQPAEAGSPPLRGGDCFVKEKWGGDVQRSCDAPACVAPAEQHTYAKRSPCTRLKSNGAATQTRTGGQSCRSSTRLGKRTNGHAPSSNLGGTTNPNAHRRPKPPQQYPAGYTHQRETKAKHPVQTQAAQPTQTHTGGEAAAATPGWANAPIRDEGRAPSPSPSGAANPNAHRRRSRRSNTRQVKRTHASQRPRTQPKPQRHSQPKRAPAAQPPQQYPAG